MQGERGKSKRGLHTPRVIDYRRWSLPLDKCISLAAASAHETIRSGLRETPRELIQQCRVQVNNEIIDNPSHLVGRGSIISVDGMRLPGRMSLSYWVLYKPRHVLTSRRRSNRDPHGLPLVTEFYQDIPNHKTILPVGRLDLESEGLLILTNDGSLNRILTSPDYGVKKVYRCLAGRDVPKVVKRHHKFKDLDSLLLDIPRVASDLECHKHSSKVCCIDVVLRDEMTFPRVDSRATSNTQLISVDVTIASGKNREVRRLLKSVGLKTFLLCRVSIQGLLVSSGLASNIVGLVRHMQNEIGMQMSLESGNLTNHCLTPEDIAWVRNFPGGFDARKKFSSNDGESQEDDWYAEDFFNKVRQKAHFHCCRDKPDSCLSPGGLWQLSDEEVDALFGPFVSTKADRMAPAAPSSSTNTSGSGISICLL